MADNNQHTPEPADEKRWGGPGSSHQNAKAEPPSFDDPRDGATNGRNSKVSGGGGERDLKHSHDDQHRSSKGDRDA
jgi:hypothetical protein